MNLNLKENPKIGQYAKQQKKRGKRNYLQDLYGTPELAILKNSGHRVQSHLKFSKI